MITVNLVPKEALRKERTPVGQFAVILLCVLAGVGSLAAFLYMEFGRLAEVESELNKVTAELDLVKPHRMYADSLMSEKKEYARRTETIQGIGAARVLWSKKMDQFWEVIHNNGDAGRHNVWITSLSAKSPGKGKGKSKRQTSGTFNIAGYSAGVQAKKLSNFHRDLTESSFFKDFFEINDPGGSVQYFKDDKEPKEAWKFNFQLKMEAKAKSKKKGKKKKK